MLHIDLKQFSLDEPIIVSLPLEFVGESVGVKQGGVLTPHMHKLTVKGVIKDLPESIKIDVSALDFHDSVHIRDISYEGIKILDEPEKTVVSILVPRGLEEAEKKVTEEEEEKPETTEKEETTE